MTNPPATDLMTADDLLRMPDDGNQYELVKGKLVCMSASSSRPAIVAANVTISAGSFIRQNRLGACGGADWGFRLSSNPDTVRAPDFAFVRAERIPASGIPDGFWEGAPDLAVEIISPSNRFSDMMRKAIEYLEAGTRLVWIIDPEDRSATILHPDGRPIRIDEDGVLDGEDILAGFVLPLRDVLV